jgi:hypothetical protein
MIDKETIQNALNETWNIRPAAEKLGIGYSTLRKYIKHHGIEHNSRKNKDAPTFDRKKYQVKTVTKFRRKRKLDALNYLGGMKCSSCGYDKPIPSVYAFHHKDPKEKDISFGKMKTNCVKWEIFQAELDKCIILCHNCHAELHWNYSLSDLE